MLNKDDQINKLTTECEYWFLKHKELKVGYDQVTAECDAETKMRKKYQLECDHAGERLSLITELQHAQNSTGYRTSWNMGGVTAECLKEEIKKAQDYQSPVAKVGKEFTFKRPSTPSRINPAFLAYIESLEEYIKRNL